MKKVLSIFFALLIIITCLFAYANVSFATTITNTIDLAYVSQFVEGTGYFWDNLYDELTLTNLNLVTNSEYGLKLPENCTVILKGDNYIKAEYAAVSFQGNVTFKGTGTLTVVGGTYGFYNYSQNDSHTVRLTEGTYNISGGTAAIYSPDAIFEFTSGKLNLESNGDFAIIGKIIRLLSGKLTSKGSIKTSKLLTLSDIDAKFESNVSAFQSVNGGSIRISNCLISAGDSLSNLKDVKEYTNENCVTLKPNGNHRGTSAIFGSNCPKFVDYILIFVAILLPALLIALIVLNKKKKAKVAMEISSEYIKNVDEEYKAKKKARSGK